MEDIVNRLLYEVKKNKKYAHIDEEIIKKEILNHSKSNLKSNLKKRDIKNAVKKIRSLLHKFYSSYQTKKKKKIIGYLEDIKNSRDKQNLFEVTNKILSSAISTKERIDNYDFIYKKIFKITGIPSTILDFGCGLNPVSFPYMNVKNLNYYAYDIDNNDVGFLNNYFLIMKNYGLNGIAEILDVRDEKISQVNYSDVTFMFKIIDIIEMKKKISEKIIKILIKKTKFIAVSFPTITLSGKRMNLQKRVGFELMLKRIGLNFKFFSTNNEIFYVIYDLTNN